MHERTQTKIVRSATSYEKVEVAVDNTETVSFPDKNGKLVVEITPYRSMGIAQVVAMTTEQSTKIANYARRQSKILTELGRTDLLLDVTYVPEEKWTDDILRRIRGGSAVFPILSLRTVPIEYVKHLLQ